MHISMSTIPTFKTDTLLLKYSLNDYYSEVTAYSVFMTHMGAKVTPTDNTD